MRTVATYYTTRNSLHGVLADKCDMWWVKPVRVSLAGRVVWEAYSRAEPGWFGDFTVEYVISCFGTYPQTDIETIVAEQWQETPA